MKEKARFLIARNRALCREKTAYFTLSSAFLTVPKI